MTKQLLQRAVDALETFRFTPEDQLESEEIADADSIIEALRAAISQIEAPGIAAQGEG